MSRFMGGLMVLVGLGLWYYGGINGNHTFVNLGVGSIIIGFVVVALPSAVGRGSVFIICEPFCGFLKQLSDELELHGKVIVIPPYENLPNGGVFITKSTEFSINLGKLREGTVFVTGTDSESGVLLSPPPGWKLVEYVEDNVGELKDTGIGYASSAISSAISALGIGSAEVFEDEEGFEVFVKPVCANPYTDPILLSVLLGVAIGVGELLVVDSVETGRDYFKVRVRILGGIEKWL